jgi:hypothetical protein
MIGKDYYHLTSCFTRKTPHDEIMSVINRNPVRNFHARTIGDRGFG